jgi:predicted 3-demethylubiquinone-9 3-methyltransferase (glyoxalase superfamily)
MHLVRPRGRGRRALLRLCLSRQRGAGGAPLAHGQPRQQGGRCAGRAVHRRRHTCIGLNGGPAFPQTEAFSFQIATDTQEETDRYWNAIVGHGGKESECGWCKDRWGVNWQITPRTLTEALAAGGEEARRAFAAMMTMRKIDVAAIDAARRG